MHRQKIKVNAVIISLFLLAYTHNLIAGGMEVSPNSFDFGILNLDEISIQSFTITNNAGSNLIIGDTSVTGAAISEFSIFNYYINDKGCIDKVLSPSENCQLKVVFSPLLSGNKNANLTLTSNDLNNPIVNIPLTGTANSFFGDIDGDRKIGLFDAVIALQILAGIRSSLPSYPGGDGGLEEIIYALQKIASSCTRSIRLNSSSIDTPNFSIDGSDFYFVGGFVPGWHWGQEFWGELVDEELLQTAKRKGINVIHLMLPQIENELSVFNEVELAKMDHFLYSASANGIYVMISFIHGLAIALQGNDPYYNPGGIEGLINDPTLKAAFKQRMNTVISRQNTFNGRIYKDDPTILAWILVDEPVSAPWNYPLGPPDVTLNQLSTWLEEMASYAKSIDPKHMITVFTQGAIATLSGDDWLSALDVPSIDFIYAEDADMRVLGYFGGDTANDFPFALLSLNKPLVVGLSFTSGVWDKNTMCNDYPWQATNYEKSAINYFNKGAAGIVIFNWVSSLYNFVPDFDKCYSYNSVNEPISQMLIKMADRLCIREWPSPPLQFVKSRQN